MKEKSLVPSPCISVCTIDEDTGFCRGCYRTLVEVAGWDRYNDIQKRAVWATLEERKQRSGGEASAPHC